MQALEGRVAAWVRDEQRENCRRADQPARKLQGAAFSLQTGQQEKQGFCRPGIDRVGIAEVERNKQRKKDRSARRCIQACAFLRNPFPKIPCCAREEQGEAKRL